MGVIGIILEGKSFDFKHGKFLSILWKFQFMKNHRKEDPYIAYLEAWGRTEADLRDGKITIDQLYALLDAEWGDENIEEDEMDAPLEFGKLWFCREECGFWCHGKNWASERSNHQRSCPIFRKLPSLFDYRHMTSRCICCTFPHGNQASQNKPWGTKFKKCKAPKVERRVKALLKKRAKSRANNGLKKAIKKK